MYDSRESVCFANAVFMYIRDTPSEYFNSSRFNLDLVSLVDRYRRLADKEEDFQESFERNLSIAEFYRVYFNLPPNINDQIAQAKLYGFKDFEGLYFIRDFFTSKQCALLALETLTSYINPPSNSNLLHNDPNVSTPIWPSESFKRLRWATIGHLYDWGNRKYNGYAEFPCLLKAITDHINSYLSELYSPFTADAAILNFYSKSYFLRLHKDDAEETDDPVLNISLGVPAIFCVGGTNQSHFPLSFIVDSGSVVIMSKSSRRCLHGVPKLLSYRKPGIAYGNIEGNKEMRQSEMFSPPYFIKGIPQCLDGIFESTLLKFRTEEGERINRFLSESRISISIRKAKL